MKKLLMTSCGLLACLLLVVIIGASPQKANALSVAAPTSLKLNDASTNKAAIIWTASTTPGVTGYTVYRNGTVISTTASYTTNYLDTGLSAGTTYSYTVAANVDAQTSSQTSALTVTTGSSAQAISACGTTISTPGDYILSADLSTSDIASCISVSSTHNISIDCQGHKITDSTTSPVGIVAIQNVSNFLITNCKTVYTYSGHSIGSYLVSNSSNGTLDGNTIGTPYANNGTVNNVEFQSVTNSVFSNNVLQTSCFTQFTSSNNYIGSNTFTMDRNASGGGVAIETAGGSGNVMYKNTIDGDSNAFDVGQDDGIVLGSGNQPEDNDIVSDNTISHEFDAGIEGIGSVSHTLITNNTLNYIYYAGISSYHYTSWLGDTVTNNKVNYSPSLFKFFDDQAVPSGSSIYFKDNTFTGNSLTQADPMYSSVAYFNFTNIPSTSQNGNAQLIGGNNVIANNDFDSATNVYEAIFLPANIFVDGGNNLCPDPATQQYYMTPQVTPYPIVCSQNSPAKTTTITDNVDVGLTVAANETTTLDGTRKWVAVLSGGKLMGAGTATNGMTINKGGAIAPGHSPGCMNSGNIAIYGTYQVDIGGTDPCTGYDQIKVTGTVDVTGGVLSVALYKGFMPRIGQSYIIIDNDSTDAVTGTFQGLDEGSTFTNEGVTYAVTYKGGDGNDIVLTVKAIDTAAVAAAIAVPKAPNTGIALITAHPLVSLISSSMAGVSILFISRRMKPAPVHARRARRR